MSGMIKETKNTVARYFILTAAAFIYAVAISLFLDPNDIAPGGVTGVSIGKPFCEYSDGYD